jgi:sugar lactone lactonase YvrE
VPGATGLAFGAGRALYVARYDSGVVLRLELDASGRELRRATVVTAGAPGADGLAFDALGRLYVTSQGTGSLLRYNADGSGRVVLRERLTSPANVEFGVGALRCSDLYVATGATVGVVRVEGDTPGADVPWHQGGL